MGLEYGVLHKGGHGRAGSMNSGAHSLGWFLLAAEGVHIVIGSGHSTPTQHVGTRCNRFRAGYVGGRFSKTGGGVASA